MKTANSSLKELIANFTDVPTLALNPLTMKIAGIVDPAVMGGISNYEKVVHVLLDCAFFTLFFF